MIVMEELPLRTALGHELSQPPRAPGTLALNWLGQAGFAFRARSSLLLVDPYLSDSLGEKYAGTEFSHRRMMPSPLPPEAARGISAVLCTHGHGDHMDPGTLPVIARGNPSCRFVVPRAETARAAALGLAEARLLPLDAGESVLLDDGIRVEAIPAAHEELSRNERGELIHLGYIVSAGGLRIYHSGDCVPYPGLEKALRDGAIDVALMPVNGRSAALTAKNIFGNFFLEETVSLARSAGIPVLFCHHWGMFDFNTVDPKEAERKLRSMGAGVRWILPRVDTSYVMRKT